MMGGCERWRAVRMRLGKNNFALGRHTVDVVDRPGNKLFEQIKGLLISQLIEPRPELFRLLNLLHANAGGLRARLEKPGTGHAAHEFAETVIIQNVHEFGHKNAGFARAGAHGQLVPKVADRGQTHAGNAEMLAERGDIFHVKFIERDDAINRPGSGHVAQRVNKAMEGKVFRHGEKFLDAFERPVGVAEFFDGQEKDAAAHVLAGADKLLALFVGTDAQNGERRAIRHSTPRKTSNQRADYTAAGGGGKRKCRKRPTRPGPAGFLWFPPSKRS